MCVTSGGGFVARRLVIGDFRVQAVERGGGRGRSFTIVWPDGAVHEAADRFLRGYEGSGTQRTYAYLLLDHLRWLEREALAPETVDAAGPAALYGGAGRGVARDRMASRGGPGGARSGRARCRRLRRA